MLIKVEKVDFTSLSDTELGTACFKPLIDTYKNRVANLPPEELAEFKEEFYRQLNESQQALFMFYTIYNHIQKSVLEFYWWNAYFFAQPKSWTALKNSMVFFEDKAFLRLLEKIEEILARHNHPVSLENFHVTREELHRNEELSRSIEKLFEQFLEIAPSTVHKINQYIQQNLNEFVEVV